ncbi:N-acetylmuramoyl-L-alanine amidase [Pelagibacteraceae bacterium]|nr:N-acetylmuramoyl-L-alanine amidase [Pelagibacteraceae bacterium]
MKITNFYSPNFDKKKRSYKSIKFLVIHYTGMQSERESIKRLCNPKAKVSSHYLINQNGKVYRLVMDNRIAWHAGKSCWGKYKNLNKNSIGIEMVNKGHKFGYTNFKKKQLVALKKICQNLIKKYKIKKKNIVGHSDIAPLRKLDPGEKFPWKKLGTNKIGIWHNLKESHLIKFRKIKIVNKSKVEFINKLKKIGYCFNFGRKGNSVKIIKAFQRHYRKQLINGIIDKECLIIAKNISKRV